MAFKVVGMGLVLTGLVNLTTGLLLPVAQAPELVQLGQGAVVVGLLFYIFGSVAEALDARSRGRRE